MKKAFTRGVIALIFVIAAALPAVCQSTNNTADANASLTISKNILKIIGELAKNFPDLKGTEITKTADGTVVYGVKNLEGMMAQNEYIMVKSGGAKYYLASYSGDDKKLGMSFAAFTGGVITITNADGNFSVEQNKEKSTDDKLVYYLLVKGTKIGSYSMDVKKKEGTMIIGFL